MREAPAGDKLLPKFGSSLSCAGPSDTRSPVNQAIGDR